MTHLIFPHPNCMTRLIHFTWFELEFELDFGKKEKGKVSCLSQLVSTQPTLINLIGRIKFDDVGNNINRSKI